LQVRVALAALAAAPTWRQWRVPPLILLLGVYGLFGFHLLNTTGVLVQEFTVHGFGDANIRIEGGSGNTLRKNVTTLSGMGSGIRVINSSANVVEQNSSSANQGAGITVTGAAAFNNIIRHNETFLNGQAGLQIVTSGLGNVLFRNDSHENPVGLRNVVSAHGSVIENNHVDNFASPWN